MLRKTISIDEQLYRELEQEGVLDRFKNFSDLVSSALRNTVENIRKENYRRALEEMANDPLVKSDIEEIQEDFKYADSDSDVF